MTDVCVVGSLNIDVAARVANLPRPGETVSASDLSRAPGGKGANQALAAARAGAETMLMGRIGDDSAGSEYLAGLGERGVDCLAVVVTDATPSGHALIAVNEAGENTIIVAPGANAAVTTSDVDRWRSQIADARVLLLQFELPDEVTAHAARLAKQSDTTVVLNPSPFKPVDPELLADIDILVVNELEQSELGDTGVSTVVTLGADGARWDDVHVPSPSVEHVDTTGAGDAFTGTFAAALASGADKTAALEAAVAAGSAACEHHGAQGWVFGEAESGD
ncbi:ribokinase [Stackebrandtia nassauensis]|uniref:Ribokinase n=1 Tax=Stackebrandtia nassauensis (strain DSM 44728 / CIP 108903 / NRRL B-16338 / NBRC 102104 / LLR-40K-21) TaxID=446470 RepID=D3Q6W6_STANL|nr:ribokinase [Stackebrandtia nassauensis]ADD40365.1 PfkB domain protein [Stackebrandtia nassauensis DSM 44728]